MGGYFFYINKLAYFKKINTFVKKHIIMKNDEEIKNDNQIPADLKTKLTGRVNDILTNISKIESAINKSIDDTIENNKTKTTVTEINAALLNVLKKMNQREIMELIK